MNDVAAGTLYGLWGMLLVLYGFVLGGAIDLLGARRAVVAVLGGGGPSTGGSGHGDGGSPSGGRDGAPASRGPALWGPALGGPAL